MERHQRPGIATGISMIERFFMSMLETNFGESP